MSERRQVRILWTATAKKGLAELPYKVRKGLLDKADNLLEAADPTQLGKPLVGPLAGYYRIAYSRYRAVYSVEEERLASGEIAVNITVRFVAAGQRKEGDKRDVYRLAMKLIELGAIELDEDEGEGDEAPPKSD